MAGRVGLVLGAFDLPVAEAIRLVDASLDLVVNGEREIDGLGLHRVDKEASDGAVDRLAEDALAHRLRVGAASAHAYVGGHQLGSGATRVVVGLHAPAAETA